MYKRQAWEYAFRFRDFPILAVQSFYDICRVHNASDIIRKLEKETYIFPIIFPVTDLSLIHISIVIGWTHRHTEKKALAKGLYSTLKVPANLTDVYKRQQ